MLYIFLALAVVVIAFLFISPAEQALVHDQLNSRPDDFLDSESKRLSRWFSHYNSGPQSFRDKANASGTKETYQNYQEKIQEELARRRLIRTLLSSVPELKLAGEFAYVNMLNDGMAKIAWQMHKSGKSTDEIVSWFKSEMGSEDEPQKSKEPNITVESIVSALIEISTDTEILPTIRRIFGDCATDINPEALEIIGAQMNAGFGLRLVKEKYGPHVFSNVFSLFEETYLVKFAESGVLNLDGKFCPKELVPNEIEYGFACAENEMCREPLLDREMLPFIFAFIFSVRNRIHYERVAISDSKDPTPYNKMAQHVIYQVLGPDKMNSLPEISSALSNELVTIGKNLEAAIIKNAA